LPLPTPQPGLVIGYAYLWQAEQREGRFEGVKNRPCVIVLAAKHEGDEVVVTVAPITHTPAQDAKAAVEIPAATKRRLGLDDQRSWVIVSEVNRFVWAGPDLRPVSPGRYDYGMLPPVLFVQVKKQLVEYARRRQTLVVTREV
jgi:uncharacterized protein YifN (PemK superfamily)